MEQTRICGKFSEIFGVDFGGRIFQGYNLCFWVKNLKNISKELSEERTCERGAPEHLKRGRPPGLGHSWPSFTSSFSGGFLVQLFIFVQYIFHALHRPNPVNHSFFCLWCPLATLFLNFVSFTLSHASSFITWCHLCWKSHVLPMYGCSLLWIICMWW